MALIRNLEKMTWFLGSCQILVVKLQRGRQKDEQNLNCDRTVMHIYVQRIGRGNTRKVQIGWTEV